MGNVGDNSVSSYRLHARGTAVICVDGRRHSHLLSVWSCCGSAANQRQADLQHILATQR